MQFGVMLPHRWLYAAGNTIADFAREAEDLGYSSLWVTDHIIVPSYRTERGHVFYEALTTLAYVSSIATSCLLGTAVLALPPRHAVLVAKQVATLDALTQGRVLLGVGTGSTVAHFIDALPAARIAGAVASSEQTAARAG